MTQFRILSSGVPVALIRAANAETAVSDFTDGRALPPSVTAGLSAYRVTELETKRPKASRGYRAR